MSATTETYGSNMLVVKSKWMGHPNFTMIPVKQDCPYVECIFEPTSKSLVVFNKSVRQMLRMVDKLDSNGDTVKTKKPRENGQMEAQERKTLESYLEHYITDKEEVLAFVKAFSVNEFDIEPYFAPIAMPQMAKA